MNKYIKKIVDDDGTLCVLEFKKLPFNPKRMFFIKNVPIHTERGSHAHYKTKQILICISGVIECITHNGKKEERQIMSANDVVYVKNLIWDSQIFLTDNAVLLVIANTEYDKKDYITDFKKFKSIVKNK